MKKFNYPYRAQLTVKGMVCEGCQKKVQQFLNQEVNYYGQAIDLEHFDLFSDEIITQEKVETLVNQAGYQLVEMRDKT